MEKKPHEDKISVDNQPVDDIPEASLTSTKNYQIFQKIRFIPLFAYLTNMMILCHLHIL